MDAPDIVEEIENRHVAQTSRNSNFAKPCNFSTIDNQVNVYRFIPANEDGDETGLSTVILGPGPMRAKIACRTPLIVMVRLDRTMTCYQQLPFHVLVCFSAHAA
jgi:hypothetical protein